MSILIISVAHPYYQQVLDLRQRVLRLPLGLDIYNDDLAAETEQVIFIAEENETVQGCVLLQHYDATTFKLRQMAVDPGIQKRGIGAQLIAAAEHFAQQQGKQRIWLHARAEAVRFYEKSGYHVIGQSFLEVGINHYKMEKQLTETL